MNINVEFTNEFINFIVQVLFYVFVPSAVIYASFLAFRRIAHA